MIDPLVTSSLDAFYTFVPASRRRRVGDSAVGFDLVCMYVSLKVFRAVFST